MTPNLLKFSLVAIVLTIIFRAGLSTYLSNSASIIVPAIAITYGALMWFNGYYFGRKEYEFLPMYNIGFRFHLSTFLTHNIVSILWFVFAFNSKKENIKTIYATALVWLLFIIIHYICYLVAKKSTIKNLHKKNLFE